MFLTVDRNHATQQDLSAVAIAVAVMRAPSNDLDDLIPLIPAVMAVLAVGTRPVREDPAA